MTIRKEWTEEEIQKWARKQRIVREYAPIVERIKALSGSFNVTQYGALSHNPARYPLFQVTPRDWDKGKKSILITAGNHGYEPSGIMATLEFLEKRAPKLTNEFNIAAYPYISPWGYEVNHRWDIHAEDPNRGFRRDNPRRDVEECVAFMDSLDSLGKKFHASLDLHETPDRDKELRRERADRFGTKPVDNIDHIPAGFYLVMDSVYRDKDGSNHPFGQSVINEVAKVTQIAPDKEVLNLPNHGGIVDFEADGMLATYLRLNGYADFAAITEVYPDPLPEGEAVAGQVAAIEGALNYIKLSL